MSNFCCLPGRVGGSPFVWLDRLIAAFEANPRQEIPVGHIIRFAIATAMRQDEIYRIEWAEFHAENEMLRRCTHIKPERLHHVHPGKSGSVAASEPKAAAARRLGHFVATIDPPQFLTNLYSRSWGGTMDFIRRVVCCTFVAMLAAQSCAHGQEWPARLVTIVNLFGAGSSGDFASRTVAKVLREKFGQPFVVDNRSGAGGATGSAYVAKEAPDGYTLLMTAIGPALLNQLLFKSVPYNTDTDFTPVILVGELPQLIVSTPQLGFKTLQDLIDFGKDNPAKLNIGHAGAGSMGHLTAALFLARTGVQASLVGYRGATPVIMDVLSGHIQAGVPVYIPAVSSVTVLAVTSEQRIGFLPDIPTARESGTDLIASTWIAIMGPAGLPKDIVAKLNMAIDQFLNSEDGIQQFARAGIRPFGGPPDRVVQVIRRDRQTWAPIIARENIKLDPD
jgi:tripartite-type tricarboxylate transporter receptor subunit TctC